MLLCWLKRRKMTPVMKLVLIIGVTAILVGGGTYYLVTQQANSDKAVLQSNIDTLNTKVANLEKTSTATPTPTVSASTDTTPQTCSATTGHKVYETTNYGFCFAYPAAWTVTGAQGEGGSSWRVSVTDKVVADSDYPGQMRFDSFKDVKSLDVTNVGATSLKDYLDKAAALADPIYKNVKTTTINGKAGYVADAGPNQFGGGKFYFVNLSDSSIVKIRVYTDSTDTAAVLASVKLTK
jgi:hypothetical protein